MLRSKKEVRFNNENSKFRAVTEEVDGQKVRKLRGYPILFDVLGKPYRGSKWVEKVDKAALNEVDFSQIVLLLDHNSTWVLGRVGKNMRVEIDDVGLFMEVTLGNTWIDDYVYDRVQTEIIDGMSFWFDNNAMIATDWENKVDVILKINEIYEVSIVVFPAYEETVVVATDGQEMNPNMETSNMDMSNMDENLACPNCTCPKAEKACVASDYSCTQCETCMCPMVKMLGNNSSEDELQKEALKSLINEL